MRRGVLLLAVMLVGGGSWWFFQHYEIEGLEHLKVRPRVASQPADYGDSAPAPAARTGGTIRIGTFNIQVFGAAKLDKPAVMNVLADVIRQFDVVAIQEIRAKTDDVLPRFLDLINSTGRHYDYLIGPRLGRSNSKEQYAFIYDTASIEADRTALYTVADPDDLLHREPLVAWFRVRGPPAEQAFTFTLADIHTDPDETSQELDALAGVFRVVRDDGRHEDDIIVLGDLNVDDAHLGRLGQLSGISAAISGMPTNTRGTKQYDNLIFSKVATTEYTGRSGVFDLIRQYNLTTDDALQVSDHMPVWAEFSIYEGGRGGQIATRPAETAK
ncbi:MAG TPA: endonuclease/exonuclease/phosphatase family protein [Pirellulales bacterium]|nr:endonuclease/exonuclease/phosphatase family protein [Pirellulales bacterium]